MAVIASGYQYSSPASPSSAALDAITPEEGVVKSTVNEGDALSILTITDLGMTYSEPDRFVILNITVSSLLPGIVNSSAPSVAENVMLLLTALPETGVAVSEIFIHSAPPSRLYQK